MGGLFSQGYIRDPAVKKYCVLRPGRVVKHAELSFQQFPFSRVFYYFKSMSWFKTLGHVSLCSVFFFFFYTSVQILMLNFYLTNF